MKDVTTLAREAGLFDSKIGTWSLPSLIVVELERFAALVREDEREKQQELIDVLQEAVDGMGGSYATWSPKAIAVIAKFKEKNK